MAVTLVGLFKHNLWANLRLLDACAGLSDEQPEASVPGRLAASAPRSTTSSAPRRATVAGLSDAEAPPRAGRLLGIDELRERAHRSGEALVAIAADAADDRVLRGTLRGAPFAIPSSVFLTQAINHATDHRSQIGTILTQHGIAPPDLDAWAYNAEPAGP